MKEESSELQYYDKAQFVIVEDDPITLRIFSEILATAGFVCHPFSCPIDALEFIKSAEGISAILTDITMPSLSGIQFVEKLRQLEGPSAAIPVVCVSAKATREDVRQALRLGVRDFLDKPVNAEQLVSVLVDVSHKPSTQHAAAPSASDEPQSEGLAGSKLELLNVFAHEMKTPLNGVLGFSALLSDRGAQFDAVKTHQMAHGIQECGQDLLNKVNLLIGTFAAETRGGRAKTSVQAAEIIRRVFQKAPPEIHRNTHKIQLIEETRDSHWFIDPTHTFEALTQILKNAFQHAPGTAMVSLRVEEHAGSLVFEIQDSGPGMDAQTLESVTAPFGRVDTSTTRKTDGLGLGIPFAKKKIEAQGGKFEIVASPEAGTVVRFLFCEHKDGPDIENAKNSTEQASKSRQELGSQSKVFVRGSLTAELGEIITSTPNMFEARA